VRDDRAADRCGPVATQYRPPSRPPPALVEPGEGPAASARADSRAAAGRRPFFDSPQYPGATRRPPAVLHLLLLPAST